MLSPSRRLQQVASEYPRGNRSSEGAARSRRGLNCYVKVPDDFWVAPQCLTRFDAFG